MADRTPCSGEQVIYRCTINGGNLEWQWTPLGSQQVDYIILSFLQPQSRITTRLIGDTEVVFNVTEYIMSSRITSIATVKNPELLNGTIMVCGGQSLTIKVAGRSKLILLVNATV